MRYLLEMFTVSLVLTWLIELTVATAMGLRGKKSMYLVLLVNLLTNPAAVLLCHLGTPQLPVELAVIAVEAWVYTSFSKDDRWQISHPIILSVAANLIAWFAGILIQI